MQGNFCFVLPLAASLLGFFSLLYSLKLFIKRKGGGFVLSLLISFLLLFLVLDRLLTAASADSNYEFFSYVIDFVLFLIVLFWIMFLLFFNSLYKERYGTSIINEMHIIEKNEKDYLALMMHRINKRKNFRDSFNISTTPSQIDDLVLYKLNKPIFLCGIKHSGKSTIGRLIATKYNVDFYDTDDLIAERVIQIGFKNIRDYYIFKGKEAFMQTEYEEAILMLEKTSNKPKIVALGGGACDNVRLCQKIKEYGTVLYLVQDENVIYKRITEDGKLPAFLDKSNPRESFHKLYMERHELYSNFADFIVPLNKNDSVGENAVKVIGEIIRNKI